MEGYKTPSAVDNFKDPKGLAWNLPQNFNYCFRVEAVKLSSGPFMFSGDPERARGNGPPDERCARLKSLHQQSIYHTTIQTCSTGMLLYTSDQLSTQFQIRAYIELHASIPRLRDNAIMPWQVTTCRQVITYHHVMK